jgi:hypothetical protein
MNAAPARGRWRPGLAGQVLIGLALGAATGVFLGELAAPLGIIGQVFIGLLQMTVLPYILVSLGAGLGRLSYAEAKLLALRGGGFILLFWAITLAAVVGIALAFPAWESATFFSASLAEPEREFDFITSSSPGTARPTTAHWLTAGCWFRTLSTSIGYTLNAPRMMSSLVRPAMKRLPSPSARARSPVRNHPSRSRTSAVSSGAR